MSKLPSIQFYPGDWRKDPGIQSLNLECRGAWFEILLLMFESSDRGRLLLNEKPMPDEAIAKCLGLDNQKSNQILTTLVEYGVASRDETGALVCRRMVRDEKIRKIRSESGKLGGNPSLLLKQSTTTGVKHFPTPSSSSSSSSSLSQRAAASPEAPGVSPDTSGSRPGVPGDSAGVPANPWKKFREPCERIFGKPSGMAADAQFMKLLPQLAEICDSVEELEKRCHKYRKCWPTVVFSLRAIISNWDKIPGLVEKQAQKQVLAPSSTRELP